MTNDFQKTVEALDDTALDALAGTVRAALEQRRAGVDINTIKPGMSPEDLARVRSEINRVLAGG